MINIKKIIPKLYNNYKYIFFIIQIYFYAKNTFQISWTLRKRLEKKLRRELHKNAASNIEQVLEGNTTQSTNCTATYLPSRKLSKLDEPDIQDTAGEAGTSS